jgi:ribosomal protein L7/L12
VACARRAGNYSQLLILAEGSKAVDISFVDVVLVDAGKDKIKVIQALREISTRERALEMLELARAKQLVDSTPCVVAPNVDSEVGNRVKEALEKAGAAVNLKAA